MSESAVFMLPEKLSLQLSSEYTYRWCLDFAAGPEESSTSEVQRLQKFCRRNCWVFAAPRKCWLLSCWLHKILQTKYDAVE